MLPNEGADPGADRTTVDRFALHGEVPAPGFSADVREPQKIERLGLTFPSSFPVLFGEPPELLSGSRRQGTPSMVVVPDAVPEGIIIAIDGSSFQVNEATHEEHSQV